MKKIEEIMKLEKVLEQNCSKYEDNCNSCPFQKECEKYSHIPSKTLNLIRVLRELKALIGTKFDEDEVICAFGDYEEDGESQVLVEDTSETCGNSLGYDYSAYINTANATEFIFWVDENNIITDVLVSPR